MKNIALLFVLQLTLLTVFAQDKTVQKLRDDANKSFASDTAHKRGWKTGGLVTLNIAQGSLTNWQAGGDNSSFSAVGFFNAFAVLRQGKGLWYNNLDLGYGYINTTSLGARKSDDRMDLLSKYGYQIGDKWFASGLFNFRTQFTDGFSYTKDASGINVPTLTSKFMAPAYVLLSVGFEYKPDGAFSLFASPLTQRWIVVADTDLSNQGAYGVDTGKTAKNELGAFLSAQFNKEIMKNVSYKARFDAFSNYKVKPGNIDIFWTNVIAMKVNKYISANIAVDFLYDDDAIGRLQIRQILGVGFSVKF